jgi:hypothetical protein
LLDQRGNGSLNSTQQSLSDQRGSGTLHSTS